MATVAHTDAISLSLHPEPEDLTTNISAGLRRAVADLVLATTIDGIWLIDAQARTTFVNDRTAELLGYTVEEMLGISVFEFMDDEGREATAANLERRKRGVGEQHEFKCLRKDGMPIWLLVTANPVFGRDGAYAGALALVADFSVPRAREQALVERVEDLGGKIDAATRTGAHPEPLQQRDGDFTAATANRRRARRAKVDIPAIVRVLDRTPATFDIDFESVPTCREMAGQTFSATVVDLSTNGARLVSDTSPPPLSRVEVSFDVPPRGRAVAGGLVMWRRTTSFVFVPPPGAAHPEAGFQPGFGLLFEDLALPAREAIAAIVDGDNHMGYACVGVEDTGLATQEATAPGSMAIDQLAARIAHEINTPLQFLADTLGFLAESFRDVTRLVDGYEALRASLRAKNSFGAVDELLSGIEAQSHALDLISLKEEVPKALVRMSDGLARITETVRTLPEWGAVAPRTRE